MAHKKATKKLQMQYSYRYKKCSDEAIDIVEKWFEDTYSKIDDYSIYIVWFAFTKNGYRCMLTSKTYKNNFFEITKNIVTGETICLVLRQVEYIVHPGNVQETVLLNNS